MGMLKSFLRVFHGLSGMLLSCLMILFSVGLGGGTMRMRGEFMHFCRALMILGVRSVVITLSH